MRIAGKELNLAEDVFKLQHLLDCHLLKHRDVSLACKALAHWSTVACYTACASRAACTLDCTGAHSLAVHAHSTMLMQDVEELCGSAVKEEQIETKLASIAADWAEQNLNFADYKTRGPVILKVGNIWRATAVHGMSAIRLSWTLLLPSWTSLHALQVYASSSHHAAAAAFRA